MRVADVAPLETGLEWAAADVADADGWTHRLSPEEIVELERALVHARSVTGELLEVTRADFPLDGLERVLKQIGEELVDGRGFHRISGLPVERLGEDDSSWIYWGIGLHLGDPWPQNVKGHLLGDVKDQGKSPDDPTARGNELGGVAQPFHSDGSDLIGLMCLHPGVSGGESRVANALAAHNDLVRESPELAAVLYQGLPYDFRGEEAKGGRPYYSVPAFSRHRDRLFIRYIPPYIRASQRHDDAPRLSEAQKEAMAAFDRRVGDPSMRVEMVFEPGDMQFVNNYHVLHGRNAYVDDSVGGRVRWLKRLWLASPLLGPDDRPARFQTPGSTSHWGRRRTRA